MDEFDAGSFQGRVLTTLTAIEKKLDQVNGRLDNHGKRLRALEIFCYGVLTTVLGWFGWSR